MELNVANISDGQKVAYVKRFIEMAGAEVSEKIKKAETARKHRLNQPSDTSIRNPEPVVNKKLSERDSIDYGKMSYADISAEQQKIFSEERDLEDRKRKLSESPEIVKAMDEYSDLFSEMKEAG